MSNKIGRACLLLMAALLFVSCLDDDYTDDITLYDDNAITQFNLTTAKLTVHTTTSGGEDSTYVIHTETVADYPFYIDQLKGEIFNVDSLPKGIDATKMLCSISTKNNAMVFLENYSRDSLRSLTSTDSVDFSVPRYLRVYASNGLSYREYKVTVNVHTQEPGQFRWTQMAGFAPLASMGRVRLVVLGDSLALFGQEGGHTVAYKTADGENWKPTPTQLGAEACANMATKGDTLFAIDGGKLLYTLDARNYTAVDGTQSLPQALFGADSESLYGLDQGRIVASADGGRTWADDQTGDDLSQLPATDLASTTVAYHYVADADYVLLAGNRDASAYADDSTARVWRKVAEHSEGSEPGKWVYMEADSHNAYPLPRLDGLTVVDYNGCKLAFGGQGVGACDDAPYANVYESRDWGLTWKPSATYALPDAFDAAATATAAATDAAGNLWIVCAGSGQVWRARLNSIDWAD